VAQWDDQSDTEITQPKARIARSHQGSERPEQSAGAVIRWRRRLFECGQFARAIAFTGDLTTFFVVRFTDFASYRAVWTKTDHTTFQRPRIITLFPAAAVPRSSREWDGDGYRQFASTVALTAGSYLTVASA
jgi:hypothetical protein